MINIVMKKFVLLVGMPFSGKTSLAKKLEKKLNFDRISFDDTWVRLESDKGTAFELTFESVTEYIRKDITKRLDSGRSVIYDSLNDTSDQRDMWRDLASQAGADFVIIFLDIPIGAIKRRRHDNVIIKDRHSVKDKLFDSALKKFVPNGTRSRTKCPSCGDHDGLIFQDGCLKCKSCGFSQCE